MKLTEKEASRYNRQILIDEIGETGQLLLKQARVLIVGVGGLGSPIALYLAGAGVGTIGLIDDDTVSETNLQRQVLYSEPYRTLQSRTSQTAPAGPQLRHPRGSLERAAHPAEC